MENFDAEERTYEKRFRMPEDEVLRERLKGIQHTVKDFQREYPEMLSFTMYGSMVKGTATQDSDIDGTMFIETTPTDNQKRDREIWDNVHSGNYRNNFRTSLKSKLGLSDTHVGKDVRLVTISEDEVATAAQKLLLERAECKKQRDLRFNTRRDTGRTEMGPFGESPVYEYNIPEPKLPFLPPCIDPMFNLDIGGGIRKYRKQFLDTLTTLSSEEREEVLSHIESYLSFTEGGKRKAYAKFPHTYEDFKQLYS